jgi:hypothetical protein
MCGILTQTGYLLLYLILATNYTNCTNLCVLIILGLSLDWCNFCKPGLVKISEISGKIPRSGVVAVAHLSNLKCSLKKHNAFSFQSPYFNFSL